MPKMIRQGDTTDHGGTVLEGFPFYLIEHRPASAMGHLVSCPLCKGVFPIIEGNPSHQTMGRPMAYEGMKTACGARLIASQSTMLHSVQTGGVEQMQEATLPKTPLEKESDPLTVQLILRHHVTGAPLGNTAYTLEVSHSPVLTGMTDRDGKTQPIPVELARNAAVTVGKHR